MNQEGSGDQAQIQKSDVKDIHFSGDHTVFTFAPVQIGTKIEHTTVITAEGIEQKDLKKRSPYKALKRFDVDDSEYFFGRYQLTEEMRSALETSNLILVLGASGSGKSSVVRAKLIPEFLSTNSTCHNFVFTPKEDPFQSLHESLIGRDKVGPDKDYCFSESKAKFVLEGNPNGKPDVLAQVVQRLKDKDSGWLIFVDQFEELFTRCTNLEQRGNFIKSITQIAESKDRSVKIVLAMRADFLEQFSPYPRFGKIVQRQIHLVTDMPEDELELAIKGPAAKNGVRFEPGLVQEIIADVQGQAGSLPLMQYTLTRLWEYEVNLDGLGDRRLDTWNYRALGKVRGALEKHVSEIYEDLGEAGQRAAKRIFLSLVKVFTTDGVEKRVSQSVSRSALQGEAVPETINRLIKENLLVSSAANLSQAALTQNDKSLEQQATIEIAHEILLTSWDKLKEWLQEAQDILLIRSRLEEDMRRWHEQNQSNQELLKSSVLAKVLELKEKQLFELQSIPLSAAEKAYIAVSEQFQKRELKRARRVAAGALMAVVVSSGLGLMAWNQTKQAELNQADSLGRYSQSLFSEGKELDAVVQAIRAGKTLQKQHATDPVVMRAVQQAIYGSSERQRLEGHDAAVKSVSFSPDGKTLATGSDDTTIKLWNVETGKEIRALKGHDAAVNSVSFSPDGKTVATGSADRTIKLWNVETGEVIRTPHDDGFLEIGSTSLSRGFSESHGSPKLVGHDAAVNSVSFSPDGKTLATGSTDQTIKLWNVETGKKIRTFKGHDAAVNSVSFSPDGKTLVTGGYDVKLWNVETGEEIRTFKGHDAAVKSVSFSPDGKTLVTGSHDVKLWNVETGEEIRTLKGHDSYIWSVSFSPDGKTLVTGSADRTTRLWNAETGKEIRILKGHDDVVTNVSFSPDGKTLATGSADKTIKLWNVETDLVRTLKGHDKAVNIVSFSPDGKTLASSSYPQDLKLWNVETGKEIRTLKDSAGASLSFSPDGKTLAVSNFAVKLLDVKTGEEIRTFKGHENLVLSVKFSPDGKLLATGSGDLQIKLWNVETGKEIRTFKGHDILTGHESFVNSVSFSPDGKFLVTGSADRTIKLWNVETGEEIGIVGGHDAAVTSVSFSPDGTTVATGSDDKTIKLWNGRTVISLNGHAAAVTSVSFSPDSTTLATGSTDQTTKLWSVKTGKEISILRGHDAAVSSVSFSPDGKLLATGSDDKTIKLWVIDLNLDSLIGRSCDRVRNYLTYNPHVSQSDRHLCDGVGIQK